jgi:hypothetical protein
MTRRALVFVLALLLVPSPWRVTASESPPPSAAAIVAAYNGRNFGSPGWRRIFLELKNGAAVARTFTILHLWRQEGDEVRSLVLLEEPVNLRGTNYLLVESLEGGATGMQLSLFLPAGKRRVLTIRPSRFDEGLLGSDFSYSDLRWAIPAGSEYRLDLRGTTGLAGRTAWVVEAQPVGAAISRWSRIRYFIARDSSLLLGADYYRGGERRPTKSLRVEEMKQIEGVWTPVRMMMRLAGGRSSVLTLKEAGFGSGRFPPDLFVADNLPLYGDRLQAGDPVVELAPGVRP